ncbi:MAG: hypothetical protein CHACPFDD_03136 [Phycisphaerae bacterium]|nr:hypothetical protein [Phycisphaerae bacterium]
MPNVILGMDAKLYYGNAGSSATNEMTNVRDVTVSAEAGEADVTTRANSGWRATVATLRECSIEFEMVWDPADAGFAAVKTAYLNSELIAFKALDQAGGTGVDADFSITSFTQSQPLEEAITVSVTAKLAVFRAWT